VTSVVSAYARRGPVLGSRRQPRGPYTAASDSEAGRSTLLHSRRKKLTELAAREAAGEALWSEVFDQRARTKVLLALEDAVGASPTHYEIARGLILRDEGILYLVNPKLSDVDDLRNYIMTCDDSMMPTVIEALARVCSDYDMKYATKCFNSDHFNVRVIVILREHRISYELIDSQMVEFSSRELHQSVVAPTLQLLAGKPQLAKVESAYHDALDEISRGNPADAITDAARALQELLAELGCEGNSLGPLIKSARTRGLLAPHDSPMVGAVEKILSWVSADRSEKGDAHISADVTISDAWFIVHIVGAAILRLSSTEPR
jgi:hypothetical protein